MYAFIMNMTMRHMTFISAPKASLVAVNPRGDPNGMARGTLAAIRRAHMNGSCMHVFYIHT